MTKRAKTPFPPRGARRAYYPPAPKRPKLKPNLIIEFPDDLASTENATANTAQAAPSRPTGPFDASDSEWKRSQPVTGSKR